MNQKTKNNIIQLIKGSLSVIIILFIVKYIKTNTSTLIKYNFQINYLYLTISFLILIIYFVVQFILWYYITYQNKCSINLRTTFISRVYSNFGKYVPGKIFGYAILLYSYEKGKQSKILVTYSMFIELLASVLAAALLFFLSLFCTDIVDFQKYRIITFCLLCLSFIMVHPKILDFFSVRILKIFKKEPVRLSISYLLLIKLIMLYIINYLLFGIAFLLLIKSVYDISFSNYLFICGTTVAAGLIGMFAVFVPAGLGVREGMLVYTLGFVMPPALAGVVALTSRLWMTFAEIFLFGLILLFSKGSLKRIKDKAPQISEDSKRIV